MYLTLTLLSLFVVVSSKAYALPFGPGSQSQECLDVIPPERKQCGHDGISEVQCTAALNCCFFNGNLPNVPNCYTKKAVSCDVFPTQRKECAVKKTETECKNMGCCYEPGLLDIPACFNKN